MPLLRDVQHAMRRGLLQNGSAPACIVGAGLVPGQRLDIYRNTMLGTLANALRLTFPAVHRLVGADFFAAAAHVFAFEQPPRSADLNAYGAEFPDFLGRFEPAATLAYLGDVARLEWAVNRALRAAEAQSLDPSTLSSVAPSDHDRVCFEAHPSISMLHSSFPVDAIWRAVLQQDDAAMAAIDLQGGAIWLIVHRAPDRFEVERLNEREWRFANELFSGRPLGAELEAAPRGGGPALLARHLLAGHCISFRVAASELAP
jgi:hypothetical protein